MSQDIEAGLRLAHGKSFMPSLSRTTRPGMEAAEPNVTGRPKSNGLPSVRTSRQTANARLEHQAARALGTHPFERRAQERHGVGVGIGRRRNADFVGGAQSGQWREQRNDAAKEVSDQVHGRSFRAGTIM